MPPNVNQKKIGIEALLFLLIFFGIFFRFYELNAQFVQLADEPRIMFTSIKLYPLLDPTFHYYTTIHPSGGLFFFALGNIFSTKEEFPVVNYLRGGIFDYFHLAYNEFFPVIQNMRFVLAVTSILTIGIFYLLAKETFGKKEAFVSTALFSISYDILGLSRLLFYETPQLLFILLTFLFVQRYTRAQKHADILLAAGTFLIAVGMRMSSFTILPALLAFIIVYTPFKTGKRITAKGIITSFQNYVGEIGLLLAAGFVGIAAFWPDRVRRAFFAEQSDYVHLLDNFSPVEMAVSLLTRDNFLYKFTLLAITIALFLAWMERKNIRTWLSASPLRLYLVILFIVNAIIYIGLAPDSPFTRYSFFNTVILYLFSGTALLYLFSKTKWAKIFLTLAIIFTILESSVVFPYFMSYNAYGLNASPIFDLREQINTEYALFQFLSQKGNPPIITNELNLLMFYPGIKLPLMPSDYPYCTEEALAPFSGGYFIHRYDAPDDPRKRECPLVLERAGETVLVEGTYQIQRIE